MFPPAAAHHAGLGATVSAAARQAGSSGCKGSLRAFALRTKADARAAPPGPHASARAPIATAHHTALATRVSTTGPAAPILGVYGIVARFSLPP